MPTSESATRRALGEAHGAVSEPVTVFDTTTPAVTNLAPALLDALRRAAAAAAADGVGFVVNGGWRSPEYQAALLREAIAEHGSAEEAARWVATPDTSAHVAGHAVDLGPPAARAWLAAHGAEHGLCLVYRNEPWHFELRPEGCPPLYPDPSHDPRLRR
ncbi:D-alanyl-D-alanine carboxypeptidase family protein [Actinosynnema sp. NPDC020468]|uniref:D-alanyl-D-alanine carboxypeptidase family protein n=1 Tax=Actinosynnema sp. NPDC020468 TaxID=3154488 RepID=UPI0034108B04